MAQPWNKGKSRLVGPLARISREAADESLLLRPHAPHPDSGLAPRPRIRRGVNRSAYLTKESARILRQLADKHRWSESRVLSRLLEKFGEMALKDTRVTL